MPAWNNIKRWGWVKVIYVYHQTSVYIACSHSRSRSNRRGELEPSAGRNTVGVLHFSPTDWRWRERERERERNVRKELRQQSIPVCTLALQYHGATVSLSTRRRTSAQKKPSAHRQQQVQAFLFFQLTLSLLFVYFVLLELWSVTRGVCLILCIILPMCVCRYVWLLFFSFPPS